MNKKSKFVLFLLSFIPGLSHLYLGLRDRALIFIMSFFGVIAGVTGVCVVAYTDDFFPVLLFVLPLIWLIALVDAFSMNEKIQAANINGGDKNDGWGQAMENSNLIQNPRELEKSNRKLITLCFSIVPGAGHMYMGLQKMGLEIMSIFFFTVFFMGWLHMSLFVFILPVIWFYSFFDALHRFENGGQQDEGISLLGRFHYNPKWIGWGLIALGGIVVVERIIYPLIPWEIRNYLQTGMVALILILSGVKLLIGTKDHTREEDNGTCENGE